MSASTHPLGGKVVSGSASITQSGNVTDVRQSSADVSIDWLSFNVGSQATVDYLQPSASSVAVNRILGNSGSEILGHLDANGQVYLINPNGIIFGQGAEVNVGGLVASTLDANDSSLSSNTQNFSGSGTGSIVNQGTITAANGGFVALLGNHVGNQGVIAAQLGTVALGAGSAVRLDFRGNRLVHLLVDQSTLNDLAANDQLIEADGGLVIMTAGAQRSLLASVVNNSGVIEARTVESHDGTIELLGGMTAGTVRLAGTLDASAPDGGNGGLIETNAAHVEVANGTKVTTAAARGLTGSWLLDPQDFTVAPSGGDITGATLSSELGTTSVTLLSSSGATAGSGNINIDDTVSWSAHTLTLTAANNINVNAVMTATGSAALALNPATANGADAAVAGGTVVMGLNGSGFTGMVNFNSTGTLSIGGTPYTVINSLGAPGSTTGTDLQGINGNLSGHYALGSNIDATATSAWNSGTGFTPVGTSTGAFSGVFDGLGHTIGNLAIDLPSTNDVGLFGFTASTAVIRNVGLSGGSVTGNGYVGALVGVNGGTLANAYTTGTATATNNAVGGLAGSNYGTISNGYATGNVTSLNRSSFVGGLLGLNNGTISYSYATGVASGEFDVGGLVGLNKNAAISDSYATGSVVGGQSGIGGLVGYSYGGSINSSYATGKVTGTFYDVGGLVGDSSSPIANSHATGSVSGGAYYSGGLVGINDSSITGSSATGSVTVTKNYAGGLAGSSYGPITKSYATGSVTAANNYAGGLVGFSTGQTSNSYSTGRVSGSNYVGGLVGYSHYGSITNSYARGGVSGAIHVGGLVGSISQFATVANSYATGGVSGSLDVGGLVGSNTGTVSNSFWDITATGQTASAGGIGMTTANMMIEANFISATAANGNVNPGWDFVNTWVMYDGHTYPLLTSFMTPLTVTANGFTKTYDGSAFSGGNGVTYSTAPNANLLGKLNYGGNSQGAANAGVYAITPGGLYSTQQGYDISFVSGALTINQLASVVWVGGAAGDWSTASNWAGGAIPDLSNVAAVTIPKGDTVTYDTGMIALGTTKLKTLSSSGNLVMAAGTLDTTGNLSTAGFNQTGGTLDVGGTLSIQSGSGGVTLGSIAAGSLNIISQGGAITQLASTALDVTGASTLTADNGATKYAVTLAQAGDGFGGTVTAEGSGITLDDKTALTAVLDSNGAATLTAAGAMKVSGTVGTTLSTTTTGAKHATTLGKTTVGKSLVVTSTGAVTETSSNIVTVAGKGTTTVANPDVKVNGVKGAKIPAP